MSSLFNRNSNSDQMVKIVMAERIHFVFYFLLLSQGHSKPSKDLSVESCDPTFTETSHFPASLLDCTTSLPLIVGGYSTTTSLTSTAFPTTISFESMVNNNDSGNFHCHNTFFRLFAISLPQRHISCDNAKDGNKISKKPQIVLRQ